jgi:hypothetical protein
VLGVTKLVVMESFAALCAYRSRIQAEQSNYMKATSALLDEFDKTRLFLIEEPDMKTPQLSQIVSPHDAVEIPVPINDHA